jgi:hypothetical protein
MNKETKKFNEVIKKRKNRVVRLARAKAKPKQVFKWVELPKEKLSWWRRLLAWLKIK